MDGKDPLWRGKEFISKSYKLIKDTETIDKLKEGAKLIVPSRVRWRKEEEFYLLNIRWGNTIEVPSVLAVKLIKLQKQGITFTVEDFGDEHIEFLAMLVYKDAITSPDIVIDVRKTGVSIDPSKLAKLQANR